LVEPARAAAIPFGQRPYLPHTEFDFDSARANNYALLEKRERKSQSNNNNKRGTPPAAQEPPTAQAGAIIDHRLR